jgi:hypothetical protein
VQPLGPSSRRLDSGTPTFDGVIGRRSVDYLLRNVHQQLVQLSVQADLKASVMITSTSIVLSLTLAIGEPDEPRPSLIVLAAGIVVTLALAILTLLPKLRLTLPRRRGREGDFVPDLLFFGDFARLPRDRYLADMAMLLRSDAEVYRTLAANLHNQGVYLQRHKYRYLRLSYTCFLGTIVVSGLIELARIAAQ